MSSLLQKSFETEQRDKNGSDNEEDYMSMTIVEPPEPHRRKEPYSEMRRRKQREVCELFQSADLNASTCLSTSALAHVLWCNCHFWLQRTTTHRSPVDMS